MKAFTIKILGLLILISFLIGLSLYFGLLRFNYPNKITYPIRGVDISHHQGDIDWIKLQTEDIDFVYIKASEGSDYQDSKFKDNWRNALLNNYKTGAYHFYLACSSGIDQAKNFIKTVPIDSNALPPVVDLEFKNDCKTNKSKVQILLEINDFIDSLKRYYNKTPIIYTTYEFYNEYLKNDMPKCKIWIRDIFCHPKIKDDLWIIWQYSNRGRLKGIPNYVDLNVMKSYTMIEK